MSDLGKIVSAAGTQSVESFEDALLAALPPIYDKEDKGTPLAKLYSALAQQLVKADIILESVGNNNYISISITDELQIRNSSPRDRLSNENAYQLDKVRFTPSGSRTYQDIKLQVGENTIQLYFIPEDIDFIIFNTNDPNQVPLLFPTTYDSNTNSVNVQSTMAGIFTISYVDTGDVVRLNENVTVPVGLFLLGWDDGGYSELGFGE